MNEVSQTFQTTSVRQTKSGVAYFGYGWTRVGKNVEHINRRDWKGSGDTTCDWFYWCEYPQAIIAINFKELLQILEGHRKLWTQWSKSNPDGVFVVNKKPPEHFRQYEILDNYHGTICFQNGHLIFTGSLKNYLAHDGKEFGYAHLDETKDTKREALTTVILGRLRQYGVWVMNDVEGRPYFFDDRITPEEAEARNLTSFNPCYVHTSPSLGDIDGILDLFGNEALWKGNSRSSFRPL